MAGYRVRFDETLGCEVKGCSRCHVEKPITVFYKRPGGYHAPCKECENAINKARYDADPGKYRMKVLESARRHPERVRARYQRWQEANLDRRRTYWRRYREMHREEQRAYARRHHAQETAEDHKRANAKMAARGYFRHWRLLNIERVNAMTRVARQRNPEPDRLRRWKRTHATSIVPIAYRMSKADIIVRDGALCYLCNKAFEPDKLTIEHVIPLSRGGTHTPENLRVACVPCNCSKGAKLLCEFLSLPTRA